MKKFPDDWVYYKMHEWDQSAYRRVEEWIRNEIKRIPPKTDVKIGNFARQTRKIGIILPEGNRWGVRHILLKLEQEGLIRILDKLTFEVL